MAEEPPVTPSQRMQVWEVFCLEKIIPTCPNPGPQLPVDPAMQIVLFLISWLLFNHQLSLAPKLSQHDNWHMLCLLCGLTLAKWWAEPAAAAGGGSHYNTAHHIETALCGWETRWKVTRSSLSSDWVTLCCQELWSNQNETISQYLVTAENAGLILN